MAETVKEYVSTEERLREKKERLIGITEDYVRALVVPYASFFKETVMPYFLNFFFHLPLILRSSRFMLLPPNPEVETAATSGDKIYFNEEFLDSIIDIGETVDFNNLSPDSPITDRGKVKFFASLHTFYGIMFHELLHEVFRHPEIMKSLGIRRELDRIIFNIATDAYINELLDQERDFVRNTIVNRVKELSGVQIKNPFIIPDFIIPTESFVNKRKEQKEPHNSYPEDYWKAIKVMDLVDKHALKEAIPPEEFSVLDYSELEIYNLLRKNAKVKVIVVIPLCPIGGNQQQQQQSQANQGQKGSSGQNQNQNQQNQNQQQSKGQVQGNPQFIPQQGQKQGQQQGQRVPYPFPQLPQQNQGQGQKAPHSAPQQQGQTQGTPQTAQQGQQGQQQGQLSQQSQQGQQGQQQGSHQHGQNPRFSQHGSQQGQSGQHGKNQTQQGQQNQQGQQGQGNQGNNQPAGGQKNKSGRSGQTPPSQGSQSCPTGRGATPQSPQSGRNASQQGQNGQGQCPSCQGQGNSPQQGQNGSQGQGYGQGQVGQVGQHGQSGQPGQAGQQGQHNQQINQQGQQQGQNGQQQGQNNEGDIVVRRVIIGDKEFTIVDDLTSNSPEQKQGQGQEQGQSQKQGQNQGNGQGDRDNQNGDKNYTRDFIKDKIKRELKEKYRGAGTIDIAEKIKKLYEPTEKWKRLLEDFVKSVVKAQKKKTWTRLRKGREFYANKWKMLFKGEKVKRKEGVSFFFVIDTSGSMTNEEYSMAKSLILSSLAEGVVKEVIEIRHTDRITGVIYYTDKGIYKGEIKDGKLRKTKEKIKYEDLGIRWEEGGTSHKEVFAVLEKAVNNGDGVVFATDFISDVEEIYRNYSFLKKGKTFWLITDTVGYRRGKKLDGVIGQVHMLDSFVNKMKEISFKSVMDKIRKKYNKSKVK